TLIVGVGDLNGDGKSEYAIAAPASTNGGANAGDVDMFDGTSTTTTNVLLWRASGSAGDLLGTCMTPILDVTGDGVPDMMIGAPGAAAAAKIVFVDGLSGAVVTTIVNTLTASPVSMALLDADVDTLLPDGKPEIVVLDSGSISVLSSGFLNLVRQTFPLFTRTS